jgi:hypothetical protein
MLPFLALKSSSTIHSMLNPLPGLLFLTVIYPFSNFIECLKTFTRNVQNHNGTMELEFKTFVQSVLNLDDLVSKIHFMSLKLTKNFHESQLEAKAIQLLNFEHFESMASRINQFNISIEEQRAIQSDLILKFDSTHKFNSNNIKITFDKIQDGG